jgi:hypothetical protein
MMVVVTMMSVMAPMMGMFIQPSILQHRIAAPIVRCGNSSLSKSSHCKCKRQQK